MVALTLVALVIASAGAAAACDVCDMLGGDDIQGLKSAFAAGNKVRLRSVVWERGGLPATLPATAPWGGQAYYVGGHYNCWKMTEDETIGLTHPFYHDLRSRGDSIASYKGVGKGNDFHGWEFYSGPRPPLSALRPPPSTAVAASTVARSLLPLRSLVDTHVLYGTVLTADGMRWENPAPKRMFWRPVR